MNVGRLLQRCAQQWADQTALLDTADGKPRSFDAFVSQAFGLGASLRRGGLQGLDRVAILGDNTADYLLWDYGVMSAGLVRVPLDPSLSVDEQCAQLLDAQARMLAHGAEFEERARALASRIPGLQRVALESASQAAPASEPFDAPAASVMASLNYTGGTTGEPKAVIITHGSLTSAVQNIVMARGQGVGDTMVNMRPLWPIAAIVVLAQLVAGGAVVLAGRFDPKRFLDLLGEHRAASASLVPTHLARLMKETDPRAHDLTALRSIDVGAAAIPPEVFEWAIDALGPRIGIIYGLTEASWSCYQPPSALADPDTRAERLRTVGHPLFGVEVRIEGEEGSVGTGEVGEVWTRGAHLAAGYWRKPEQTEQAFVDGWFRTGDLGRLDASGILRITGRIKEVIRTGGKSVQPVEVERALCAFPGVLDAAVAGLPDPEWGETIGAAVVVEASAPVTEEALMDHCRAMLSGFKKPRLIRFVASIPRSHYGKIQRAKVRAMLVDDSKQA